RDQDTDVGATSDGGAVLHRARRCWGRWRRCRHDTVQVHRWCYTGRSCAVGGARDWLEATEKLMELESREVMSFGHLRRPVASMVLGEARDGQCIVVAHSDVAAKQVVASELRPESIDCRKSNVY
ncbi:hypothetical protein U1Q18_024597, partial [Sarracenia purpurea var. burkii]